MSYPVQLTQSLTTKSGIPITFGTGTGTKWQWLKKGRGEDHQGTIDQNLVDLILLAIESGFNHIDTAEFYTTQPEVGAALAQTDKKREDLFITTKYSPGHSKFPALSNGPKEFFRKALKDLGTSYIDLVMIHHPFFNAESPNSFGYSLGSAWKELVDLKKEGLIRYLGVSNYGVKHLEETFAAVDHNPEYYPIVDQIEFHPYLQSQSVGIHEFAAKHNILIEAYGPLTPLFRLKKKNDEGKEEFLTHPLQELLPVLSSKYSKTDAQILLRYTYQKGILPVTTSSQRQRLIDALDVVNFELEQSDIDEIDKVGASFHYRGFFEGLF
ncbi:uncharacterized protein KQ657_001615 [Scheffersomyces spartinae]|uniref:2-dehydropantolactone reductase n=1 Tax=Scheffersomyces spartinae TaxID=45513 RepID=A0A9P8AGM5_9ASCO|nr:uncharacterized protein KQ657_001615 [Scheffersomyces spartinae]KAG7192520.1 hypothetical protein KQ657_001615 [Scheffersomyces spartinae]